MLITILIVMQAGSIKADLTLRVKSGIQVKQGTSLVLQNSRLVLEDDIKGEGKIVMKGHTILEGNNHKINEIHISTGTTYLCSSLIVVERILIEADGRLDLGIATLYIFKNTKTEYKNQIPIMSGGGRMVVVDEWITDSPIQPFPLSQKITTTSTAHCLLYDWNLFNPAAASCLGFASAFSLPLTYGMQQPGPPPKS